MLHAQIYENLFNSHNNSNRKQTLVLVTGDGNANSGQTSFPIVVERALKSGWNVELWSWKLSLSQKFKEIEMIFPTQMKIKYLDPHRGKIIFEERARQS